MDEDFPFLGAVEIVAHEETAAVQKLAEFLHHLVGQLPVAHFHGVQPRVVENVVVLFQVDGLLRRLPIDARQPPDGLRQMPVRPRVVDGPVGIALMPVVLARCRVDCQSTYTGLVGYISRAKVHSPGTR